MDFENREVALYWKRKLVTSNTMRYISRPHLFLWLLIVIFRKIVKNLLRLTWFINDLASLLLNFMKHEFNFSLSSINFDSYWILVSENVILKQNWSFNFTNYLINFISFLFFYIHFNFTLNLILFCQIINLN